MPEEGGGGRKAKHVRYDIIETLDMIFNTSDILIMIYLSIYLYTVDDRVPPLHL